MAWDAVPGADSYHLVHQSPDGSIQSGDTQFTAVQVPFTQALPVIAGQKLRFNLTYPGSGCLALRDTVAAYAGGEEWLDGTAHADRDLAFRVLVR